MNVQVLNNDALMAAAPSIFADAPHSSRSQRYAHVPTIEVLDQLRKAGYVPTMAAESKVRAGSEDRKGFTRHLIRLRQREDLDKSAKQVGDVVPEILLINSHDGTSSFRMEGGLFRMVCSNGLIVKSADYGSIRVHHSGKELNNAVTEAANHIITVLPNIIRATKEWDKIKLSAAARTRFANKALALRYTTGQYPITSVQALTPRRNEDEAPTLWRTFNVLEENLSKGGIEGVGGTGRKSTTRSLKSVNNMLHFERGLWELAEKMAA
jgi:Domain of unknown function (DUF932)